MTWDNCFLASNCLRIWSKYGLNVACLITLGHVSVICLCSWFWILFSSSNTVALGCRCRSSRFSKGGNEITWLKSYRNIPQEKCLLCTIALIWVYTSYLHLHILFRANPYFVTRLILFLLFLPLGLLLISFFSITWWSVAWSWVRLQYVLSLGPEGLLAAQPKLPTLGWQAAALSIAWFLLSALFIWSHNVDHILRASVCDDVFQIRWADPGQKIDWTEVFHSSVCFSNYFFPCLSMWLYLSHSWYNLLALWQIACVN